MSEPTGKTPPHEDVPEWAGAYVSTCLGCTQADNHPKVQTGALDGPPTYWHHDCFVITRQPGWEDIAALIEGAAGATGHALRLHLHPDPTAPEPATPADTDAATAVTPTAPAQGA